VTFDIEHAVAVAKRQAFGAGFEATANDEAIAHGLSQGVLALPPHKELQLEFPLDWEQDPFGQRNWRAQLHMLRWMDPIRRLAAGGDRTLMPMWERIARDWLRANPPKRVRGSYAWGDMVDAMRTHALLLGLPYVEDPSWLIAALEVHGTWIADPKHLGHSNHALHQHAALLMAGSALRRDEWVALALERIREHAEHEFDDEGVNREAALGYWLLNYKWVMELARRVELEGYESEPIRRAIENVPLALAHASRPDGVLELIGDTDPQTRLRDGLGTPVLTYVATEGADGSPPDSTVAVYRAGYAFGRSGWGETERRTVEETFYSLRFGPANGVHGHMDGGSVTYFANGRPVITEVGKYAYVDDSMRDYALGRLGHNVVHVRGVSYDEESNVELVHVETNDQFDHYRVRDRGYKGVTVERDLIFARGTEALLVVDTVRAVREVTVESRWHLAPSAVVEQDRLRVGVMDSERQASLLWGGRAPKVELVRGRREPRDGWVSPRWGQAVPTTVVKAVQTGTRFRIAMAICPSAVEQDRMVVEALADGTTAFVVEGNGVRERIVLGAGRVRIAPPDGDGEAVVARRRAVVIERAPTVEDVRRFESENTAAREALIAGDSAGASDCAIALRRRLDDGQDYGASAILRDLASLQGGLGHLDPRTRTSVYQAPAGGQAADRLGLGDVFHYSGHPSAFTLSERRSTHVLELGPIALPMLFHQGDTDSLVVVLHGALNRAKTKLPRFERVRSLTGIGANVLAFGDPTLDLDPSLTLGWYLGTRGVDLHEVIGRSVARVAEQTDARRVILLGSSGGGFAALHLAALLPDATAVVMNPQTDVSRYHARFSRRALDVIFGEGAGQEDKLRRRISVAERYATAHRVGRIRYVMNRGDIHHLEEHARPLWETLQDGQVDLEVTWLDLGNGHVSPDVDTVNAIVTEEMSR
jgi:hypothetical protein